MTKEQQIAAIRAACIKANPEIIELQFGCEYSFTDARYPGRAVSWINWNESDIPRREHKQDIEIIGRTIRLADVLLAMFTQDPANRTRISVESSGQFITPYSDASFLPKKAGPYWNLRTDDLTAQSDETVQFIHNLIQ